MLTRSPGGIGEPIAWAGPFVINAEAEVGQAFTDYRSGRVSDSRRLTGAFLGRLRQHQADVTIVEGDC